MFEFQENRRRLAPYVNPNLGSESIARDEYDVRDYATPYISPKRVITNDTLMQKLIGEPTYTMPQIVKNEETVRAMERGAEEASQNALPMK